MNNPLRLSPSRPRLLALLAMLLCIATACRQSDELELLPPLSGQDPSGQYWYTRQRTRAQELELRRSFGFGFSYDAIYGGRADMNAIRCQTLSVDALLEDGLVDVDKASGFTDFTDVAHSFSEYCQVTNITAKVSGDVVIYGKEYQKNAALMEHGMDTLTTFYNRREYRVRSYLLDTFEIRSSIKANPTRYLSPAFRYALDKVARSPQSNTLVVDSLIDIFGTHVISEAHIGASLVLDTRVRRADIEDYQQETLVTKEKLNLLFVKKNTTHTQTDQAFLRQLLEDSSLKLTVKGGNTALFGNLVANPSLNHPKANEKTLDEWGKSITDEEDNPLQNNVVLTDINVWPIWELIPDKTLANRVKARVIATAPTMQELFGNRNWVNTRIPASMTSATAWIGGRTETVNNPWVCNVVAANRIVATLCREWVPEISDQASVVVAYPVYNNKVDLSTGLCVHGGTAYSVSWRYDRFVVKPIPDAAPLNGSFYLTYGCLSTGPQPAGSYQTGYTMPAYEWPGSINVADGTTILSNRWYTTRKFLGEFYLEDTHKHDNLPGWTYRGTAEWEYERKRYTSSIYADRLKGDAPYACSGVQKRRGLGIDNLTDRMVRTPNYTYYLNKNEAWYERP